MICIHISTNNCYVSSFSLDTALAQLSNDKKSAFVKAWEESEKSKVDNKYDFYNFPICC